MQYLGATEAGYDTNEEDGSMVSPTSSAGSIHQNQGVQQQMLLRQQNQNFPVSYTDDVRDEKKNKRSHFLF